MLVDVSGTELYPDEFLALLAERGVLGLERDTSRIRFVTHRLIGDAEVARAAEIVADRGRALRLRNQSVAGAEQLGAGNTCNETVSETSLARV